MDVDSVAKGLGGKNQKPHDHNRDWSEKPHWKAVRAAMNELVTMDDAGKLDMVFDLHDPGWAGTGGPEFWCTGIDKQPELRRDNTFAFIKALETEIVPLRKVREYRVKQADDLAAARVQGPQFETPVIGNDFERRASGGDVPTRVSAGILVSRR